MLVLNVFHTKKSQELILSNSVIYNSEIRTVAMLVLFTVCN